MPEDYTYYVSFVKNTVITCYQYNHIYARQMKSNSLKTEESQSSCPKLTLHSFQSESSWLRYDGQTVNGLNKCINPFCFTRFSPQLVLAKRPYL